MYYRRFSQVIVDTAVAVNSITLEQYALIHEFYNKDTFFLQGKKNVELLETFIPKLEQIKYDENRDLYQIKVLEWPYHKIMCLKCANSNPCKWKYFDEQYKEVFEYHIDQFSIFRPSTMLTSDSSDASGHGAN